MTDVTGAQGAVEDLDRALVEGPVPQPVTNEYTRNPIKVEARQFFRYNGPQLADWCGGEFIYRTNNFAGDPVVRLIIPGAASEADEGFWIIKQPDRMFIHLSDEDFHQLYSPVYPSPTEDDENERG